MRLIWPVVALAGKGQLLLLLVKKSRAITWKAWSGLLITVLLCMTILKLALLLVLRVSDCI